MNQSKQSLENCRVCGSKNIVEVLSLGSQYISDFVKSGEEGHKADLVLGMCEQCRLVQLTSEIVSPELLYRNYWYRSGVNQTMQDALADISKSADRIVGLKTGDTVVDIGSNDGTLLRSYQVPGIVKIGFEPAKNLVEEGSKGGNTIINNFFSAKEYVAKSKDKAKVITAIAMFYDLVDPNSFVHDAADCLDENGIFIIQMAYQPLMLELNAFDNICHEHVEYYSLKSLEYLLKRHGLEVFDVELNDVNGGSFRVYIRHVGSKIGQSEQSMHDLEQLRSKEESDHSNELQAYVEFNDRIALLKEKTIEFVKAAIEKGQKVFAYGASTKGNTLLQYYGLNSDLVPFIAERNPRKYGLFTVGTNIKVISEEEARKLKPDYMIVLPWHFKNEFVAREHEYLNNGGKLVFPLPDFEIISKT